MTTRWLRARTTRRALVGALALSACAAPAPQEPWPQDQVLIERFEAQEALFEQLVKEPNNMELRSRLGVKEVRVLAESLAILPVWQLDYPGPGGAIKGYVRTTEVPATLVDSIDVSASPGEAGERRLYRRIKGHWYVYYATSD